MPATFFADFHTQKGQHRRLYSQPAMPIPQTENVQFQPLSSIKIAPFRTNTAAFPIRRADQLQPKTGMDGALCCRHAFRHHRTKVLHQKGKVLRGCRTKMIHIFRLKTLVQALRVLRIPRFVLCRTFIPLRGPTVRRKLHPKIIMPVTSGHRTKPPLRIHAIPIRRKYPPQRKQFARQIEFSLSKCQ